MKSLIGSLSGLMLSVCVCTASEELEAAKAKLREHNRLWTFEAGAVLGREWLDRVPEDAELRALYARQLHGQLYGQREIREQADAILEREPDNPWGLYAQALAFLTTDWRYSGEAVESSLRAWTLLPQPEFAAAHLQTLRSRNPEAGLAFLDSLDAATLQHPEVLHARAEFEYWIQYPLEDPAYADTSLATLATLRARWPDHVSGYLSAAQQLYRSNEPQEALPLVEEALRLSPSSAHVRYLHWQILDETDLLPAAERRTAIEASIAAYRQAVPETVRGLALLTTAYRNVLADEEQAAAFEAKLLAQAPASLHASRIHQEKFQREYQRLQAEVDGIGRTTPEYQHQLRLICDAVYQFLEKPLYDDSFREWPYRALFRALSAMHPVPTAELAEAVRGLVQYGQLINPRLTYSALILLADRTPYAAEATELARGVVDKAAAEAREGGPPNYYLGFFRDALGWALYKAGHIEEGRNELEQALELSPRNTRAYYHLGQVFEQMATAAEARDAAEEAGPWLDKAADTYIAGLEIRSWGPNPCQAALAALYERRHGSREGFDEYLATFRGEPIRLTPKIDLHLEPTPVEGLPGRTLNLPPGFKVKLFSDQVDKARFMAWDDRGVLHVTNMKPQNTWSPVPGRQSTVLALPDKDGDGRADTVYKAVDDLNWPHGIAFYQGALFVADDDAIYRLADQDADGFYEERTVFAEVPGFMGRPVEHVTHTLVLDEANDKLYFHIGSGCDICREDDPERSTVMQINTDGTGRRIYAAGLRNAIGLALHPETGELWAANTGHDREGQDRPPEWITPLRDGGFYGWPFAYGDKVWTDFSFYGRSVFPLTAADSLLVANMESPAILIPAHLAPMALHFYTHDQFPPQYKHAAFVACRAGALGNDPGYKVMALFAEPDGSNARVADFLTGFRLDSAEDSAWDMFSGFFSFNSGNMWGKPVGLTTDEAGHLYLTSDEITQAIFRIEASPRQGTP